MLGRLGRPDQKRIVRGADEDIDRSTRAMPAARNASDRLVRAEWGIPAKPVAASPNAAGQVIGHARPGMPRLGCSTSPGSG